jgi:hypothetical protein
MDLCGWGYGPVAGCHEGGNEPSGSIKAGEPIDQLAIVSSSRRTLSMEIAQRFSNYEARSQGGVIGSLWGARVVCIRDIFILKEVWAQDKKKLILGTLLG